MSAPSRGVILFFSSNHAIWAERVLREAGLAVRLIPTPKELSSECGHALEAAAARLGDASAALAARGVPFDRVAEL